MGDKLIIGKFCQIATGVRFIMNGSNHAMNGISTYPFKVFGEAWSEAPMDVVSKGDTIVGNDVWIGNSVTIVQLITAPTFLWQKFRHLSVNYGLHY